MKLVRVCALRYNAKVLQKELIITWQEHIELNPEILAGKPIVKGTRIAVELIIDLLASGWSLMDIIENYPEMTQDDIRACLAYASARLHAEKVFPMAS